MKKWCMCFLLLVMSTLSVVSFADTQIFDASMAATVSNSEYVKGLNVTLPQGEYIGFDVDMTGIKSVSIKANVNTGGNFDGDVVWIRQDSPTGAVIGKINFNNSEVSVFTAPVSSISGKHRMYIYSLCGLEDVVSMETFTFSTDAAPDTGKYTPTPTNTILDIDADNWTAYDRLGRTMPDYEEAGDAKSGKTVGMFYWTWHASFDGRRVVNINDFIYTYPEARFDYNYPAWQGSFSCGYFWNEPIWGFYSGKDEWVIRRQVEMLTSAGVDVLIFDCSNGAITWKVGYNTLLSVMHQMREEGYPTPQVAFLSNFGSNITTDNFLKHVYLDMYQDGKYSDLWFYWNGKPLMLAYDTALTTGSSDPQVAALAGQIKNFFTFRYPQANYTGGATRSNQWGWLEVYPQHLYNNEEMTVGTSVNHSYTTNKITAMNANDVMGRSYTKTFTDDGLPGAYQYGYFFEEQWRRALSVSPSFVFVTGWNEWTAGRHENWGGITNAFPDQFDNEGSRDVEPTIEPLMQDNYYYQLVENVRKYKGVSKPQTASGIKTIDMDDISSWNDVSPTYHNFVQGPDRNHNGYDDTTYTNTTARNNIIESKVARDHDYIYFMAKTAEPLTSYADAAWMRLFIDVDRNYGTGWEGFDFVVNRKKPFNETTAQLEKNNGNDWTWVSAEDATYRVVDECYLVIRISKEALGLNEPMDISFKWSDNMQEDGNAFEWWTNGDTAPIGRYAYRYVTSTPTTVAQANRTSLAETIGFYVGSSKAIYSGGVINLSDENAALTTKIIDGQMYVPYWCVKEGLNTKTWWYPTRKKGQLVIQGQHKTIAMFVDETDTTTRNGVAFNTLPLKLVDGYPYIAVQTLAEAFEMQCVNLDGSNFRILSYSTINTNAARVAADRLIATKKVSITGRALLGETLTVNPTGTPVRYCWMSASTPDGPWTENNWATGKTFTVNELAAGQYIKVRVFDTNSAYYDSYAVRDLSTVGNVIYHDKDELVIDATSGTKSVRYFEKMASSVPTTGRWVFSYSFKRNDACQHVDNQAFSGNNNHVVFSFFKDMNRTYAWRSGDAVFPFYNGLPSANAWHTVSYLIDFDKNEYGVSHDGNQIMYGPFEGGFNGYMFNVYEGVFTAKDFMIYQMKNNSAPLVENYSIHTSNWGALTVDAKITDYEKDAVTTTYEWQYADKINGEYTTFATTEIPYYSTADATIQNKYIRAKINCVDARNLAAEPSYTMVVKQPKIGNILYQQEFYSIPDDIEYTLGTGQNKYLSKDSLVIDRNDATVDSYFTDSIPATSGKVVFETNLMKDTEANTLILTLYGKTATDASEKEMVKITFSASSLIVYYSVNASRTLIRNLPKMKLLRDTWRVLTVELDTETDKFSVYCDGALAIGDLLMYSYASGADIDTVTGYKWSVESNPGEGVFDYIRVTTDEQPNVYTEVRQNGELTDTLVAGEASVTCAYPENTTGSLLAALYEGGRLVSVKTTSETALNTTFEITNPELSEIRLMYWENKASLLPKTQSYNYGHMHE